MRTLAVAFLVFFSYKLSHAEPVVIQVGNRFGSGVAFSNNGASNCFVLTANHVVSDGPPSITAIDLRGNQSFAELVNVQKDLDVALLKLSSPFKGTCDSKWPDSNWINAKASSWSSKTQLEVRRMDNGRVTIVYLRWAGGTSSTITARHDDRMRIVSSDSGSPVFIDNEFVGIVKEIDIETDRVEIIRFDTIDANIGDRFKST